MSGVWFLVVLGCLFCSERSLLVGSVGLGTDVSLLAVVGCLLSGEQNVVVGALSFVSGERHVVARDSHGEAAWVVFSDNEVGCWPRGAGSALVS